MGHPEFGRHARAIARACWLAVAMVLVASMPSARADSVTGEIAVATGASPVPARVAYLVAGEKANGSVGYVVEFSARVADGRPYALTKVGGVEPVDLTAVFYSDLVGATGFGTTCAPKKASDGNGGETGTVVCGDSDGDGQIETSDRAKFAIVVLRTGARAAFKLTW